MFNIAINRVNIGIYVVNFKITIERRQNNKMREVQRHNFEFVRTEVFNLSIEEFADKIGVSKSSYQRMKSKNYDAEYYFSPIEKVCELADISLDVFSKQYLTKETYKKNKNINRHKKTPVVVFSKKQLPAFFLFILTIFNCVLLGITTKQTIDAKRTSSDILSEVQATSETDHKSGDIYYWTDKGGGSYHLNRNCPMIKNRNNIELGTLYEAQVKKKVDPCDFCVE